MILFRADGNQNIGLGHIMRCLSIADAAAGAGEECLFLTADAGGAKVVSARARKAVSLDGDYRRLDEELPQMAQWLAKKKPAALVVDSYYVTEHYLQELKELCGKQACKLVYLDDVLSFPYPCDVLINYNLFASRESYRKLYGESKGNCPKLLLGTRYAPLRKEFQNRPLRNVGESVSTVFFSTGGADHEHVALRYLRHLAETKAMDRYYFHVLLGKMCVDAPEIKALAQSLTNVAIHENVHEIYELMSRCDAAITASGSTLYELCASGVPIISYVLADNQRENARALCQCGAAAYAGDIRENANFPETFDQKLNELDEKTEFRRSLTQTAHDLVDGNGAKRIAEAINTL